MYRLLIADDEMIERKVLFKTLSQNLKGQCEIFQAENGREALEIYEKEKIQIAILDIEMPGINGIQAAIAREKEKLRVAEIEKLKLSKDALVRELAELKGIPPALADDEPPVFTLDNHALKLKKGKKSKRKSKK